MPFALAPEHQEFFHKNHFIEFEDLLSKDDAETLIHSIDEVLSKRMRLSCDSLGKASPLETFLAGRDMWRDHPFVKKIALRKNLAEIASNLIKKKPLRIAYDQALNTSEKPFDYAKLPPFFKKETSLAQSSCFQGIVCGLLLHLSPKDTPETQPMLSITEDIETVCPLPRKCGSGIYFHPETPIFLECLFERPLEHHLLIVYCEEKAVYKKETNDLHTHALKQMGYVFGDRLTSETHPIVFG